MEVAMQSFEKATRSEDKSFERILGRLQNTNRFLIFDDNIHLSLDEKEIVAGLHALKELFMIDSTGHACSVPENSLRR
jgi:hypothetical protein